MAWIAWPPVVAQRGAICGMLWRSRRISSLMAETASLIHRSHGSLSGECERGFGGDVAGEENVAAVIGDHDAAVAGWGGQTGSRQQRDAAGDRLVEPAHNAKGLAGDDRARVVDRAVAVVIVDGEFQLGLLVR